MGEDVRGTGPAGVAGEEVGANAVGVRFAQARGEAECTKCGGPETSAARDAMSERLLKRGRIQANGSKVRPLLRQRLRCGRSNHENSDPELLEAIGVGELIGRRCRVDHDDVPFLVPCRELPEVAHERRDADPARDEQQRALEVAAAA